MPPIETIASPSRNQIKIQVPKEYASYSFQVILVPLAENGVATREVSSRRTSRKSFVDYLMSCPKLDEGEELDVSRNQSDFGREVDL